MINRPLSQLADVYYGKSPTGIRTYDSSIHIYGTGGFLGYSSVPLFERDGVVVGRKGTLGNPIYATGKYWVIDTAYAVIPKKEVDSKWLYYNLSNYNLESLNEATGVPSISRDLLYRIEFPTPSYFCQRKIAEILSTIDEQIEQTEVLIAKYQAMKKGVMQDLFSRGVDKNGKLRPPYEKAPHLYKSSELGMIPKEWGIKQLSDVAEVNRGKFTARPRNDPKYYGGIYPFIQTGDIANAIGRLLTSYSQTLNDLGTMVSRSFPAGTILITIAANMMPPPKVLFKRRHGGVGILHIAASTL
jgi:type I restriction enzyme S subunit